MEPNKMLFNRTFRINTLSVATAFCCSFVFSSKTDGTDNESRSLHSNQFNRPVAACEGQNQPKTRAVAWGAGALGQLGIGSQKDEFTPRIITFFQDLAVSPVKVKAYGDKSIFLDNEGAVYVCGTGFAAAEMYNTVPRKIEIKSDIDEEIMIQDMAVGMNHAAALSTTGAIYIWGDGYAGQLGFARESLPKDRVLIDPKLLKFPRKIIKIACGNQFSAAVDESGGVWAWGKGRDGELGHGEKHGTDVPKLIEYFHSNEIKIIDAKCGKDFTLFLSDDGKVYSCGANDYGQLGHGTNNLERYQTEPRLLTSIKKEKIIKIAAGEYHSMLLSDKGEVFTFGLGIDGQTGQGDRANLYYPKPVLALKDKVIVDMDCGGGHCGVITSQGELLCWGRGKSGQLGRAEHVESVGAYRTLPIIMDSWPKTNTTATINNKIRAIACGGDHTLAII